MVGQCIDASLGQHFGHFFNTFARLTINHTGFAFVLALGEVDDLKYATAAGAIQARELAMSDVAKVIELNAASKTSVEDAVKVGLKKCAESVKGIKGAWVNDIKVVTNDDGSIVEWRVNMRVSFVVS